MDGTSTCPLLGGVAASGAARRHLRTVGVDWGDALLEDALLATSELVANAVLHGGERASLLVRSSAEAVRVEVYDSGCTATDRLVPQGTGTGDTRTSSDDEDLLLGGRGLDIVAALSQRWGVTQRPTGKSVWFEMTSSSAEAFRVGAA